MRACVSILIIGARALTGDRLGAGRAALGEQLAEAVGAVRLLVATGEPLAGQRRRAVGAREALPMPRLALVRYAAGRDDLQTRTRWISNRNGAIGRHASRAQSAARIYGSINRAQIVLTSLHLMQRVAYFSS